MTVRIHSCLSSGRCDIKSPKTCLMPESVAGSSPDGDRMEHKASRHRGSKSPAAAQVMQALLVAKPGTFSLMDLAIHIAACSADPQPLY
jgi:hypothetical protein